MSQLKTEAFDKSIHDRSTFDCGEESLNDYLKKRANQHHSAGQTRVYIAADDGGAIMAFYTLSAFSVDSDDAPRAVQVGRYPISAILLGQLGVSKEFQRDGLGKCMLVDAMRRSVDAAGQIGARIMVLHALDQEAAGYYSQFGFRSFDADPLTMYMPMDAVRASISEADAGG